MNEQQLVEKLADLAHQQWAGWTRWMLIKWDKQHVSGESYWNRWLRQCETPYERLSEEEKESDREEARKVIALLRQTGVL